MAATLPVAGKPVVLKPTAIAQNVAIRAKSQAQTLTMW